MRIERTGIRKTATALTKYKSEQVCMLKPQFGNVAGVPYLMPPGWLREYAMSSLTRHPPNRANHSSALVAHVTSVGAALAQEETLRITARVATHSVNERAASSNTRRQAQRMRPAPNASQSSCLSRVVAGHALEPEFGASSHAEPGFSSAQTGIWHELIART